MRANTKLAEFTHQTRAGGKLNEVMIGLRMCRSTTFKLGTCRGITEWGKYARALSIYSVSMCLGVDEFQA